MSAKKLAIVTGGNKGIGLATVRGLAKQLPDWDVYLTSRRDKDGEAAVATLSKEGLKVVYHLLDITDEGSVKKFKEFVKNKYGGIDILVNNAGFAFKSSATEPFGQQAEVTIGINYFGTKHVCDHLFPLLRDGARVVNVSSLAGWLKERVQDDAVKKKLSSPSLTVPELDRVMTDFIANAQSGKEVWSKSTYVASKVGLSALSIIQQRQFDKEPSRDLVINHIHPGYVDTDMTSHKGPSTPDEGARASIYAALLPAKTEIRGKFIWEDCSLREWA